MTYTTWRISYQSSEQAARAAFFSWMQTLEEVEILRAELTKLKESGYDPRTGTKTMAD